MIKHFGLDRQYIQLREELLNATDSVLSSGVLVQGIFTDQLEKWLKARTRCSYAVTVHSGTQALEIIYRFCIQHYSLSQVNVPDLTFRATLNSVLSAIWHSKNVAVQLTDVDANGIMNSPEFPESRVSNCYVGLYGAPVTRPIYAYDVIDGAQHWLTVDGLYGETGMGMSISFDPTKNLPASGNGGAIVTNFEDLYDFAVAYKNNGKSPINKLNGANFATNSKMSELDCAHVLVRAKYIDKWQQRRSEIKRYYINSFKDLPIRCLSKSFTKHADQKFVISVPENRILLYNHLYNNGVQAMIHYDRTLSESHIAQKHRSVKCLDFLSASCMLSRSVLSLPIYPELTDAEVEYIVETVKKFY